MDAREPRVRHRGFFLHSDTGEPDTGEFENPEGLVIRTRDTRRRAPRQMAGMASRAAGRSRFTHGRQTRTQDQVTDETEGGRTQISERD
jgi:hypothetical protein